MDRQIVRMSKEKMRKYIVRIVIGLTLAGIVASIVWASTTASPTMTPRASQEWSRGRVIGYASLKRPMALQPHPEGGSVVVWSNLEGQLELAHLNSNGELLLDRVLALGAEKARDPQLEIEASDRMHLLWREQEGPNTGVHYALLKSGGTLLQGPMLLSDLGIAISSAPRLALDAEDNVHALWAEEEGIYHAVLHGDEALREGPDLLIPNGDAPMMRLDEEGIAHLLWQEDADTSTLHIYYAPLDLESGLLGPREVVDELILGDRMELEGLTFSLSQDECHIFWSEYDRGLDRYRLRHASFPLDDPEQKQIDFWPLQLGIGVTTLSSLDRPQSTLRFALAQRIVDPEEGEELQIALLSIGDQGSQEELITASEQASVESSLSIDAESNLHLAWLETAGFGKYRIVYGSTAPGVVEAYNRLTPKDAVNALFNNALNLSMVIIWGVVGLIMWTIAPFLVLAIYHLITSEEILNTRQAWVVFAVAVAVEVTLSFVLPPRLRGGVDWAPVRWVAPIAATAIAVAVTARLVLRKKEENPLFSTFFVFTIVNVAVQMALHTLL